MAQQYKRNLIKLEREVEQAHADRACAVVLCLPSHAARHDSRAIAAPVHAAKMLEKSKEARLAVRQEKVRGLQQESLELAAATAYGPRTPPPRYARSTPTPKRRRLSAGTAEKASQTTTTAEKGCQTDADGCYV